MPIATLTIKNIPDAVVRKSKAQAVRNHRTLNSEIIEILSSSSYPQPQPVDVEALIARARAVRAIPSTVRITPRQLKA